MTIFSNSPEMQATWDDLMNQLYSFVSDTQSDLDVSHDWVCDQLEINSFVDNEGAWNSFYKTWQSAYDGNNWWGSEISA
tara:strand:+ start:282 stop:518 length:237 start_codon:yes stop_codon:yes gene_type:complete